MVGYGSVSRPVVHDPFRRIVEVGWASRYLAFTCLLKKLHGTSLAEHCDPPTASDPDLFSVFASWLTETEYRYDNPDGRPFNQVFLVAKDGSAAEIDPTIISISGMPELGAATHVSYGAWEWRSEGVGNIGDIASDVFPGSWWQQPTGSPQGLIVPGHADRPYLLGTSAAFACQGQAFTAGPVCYAGGSPELDFNFADYSSTLDDFSPFTLDLSGVVIVHRNKAYRVIARQIVQLTQVQPPVGTIPQQPGVLWVLCERSKADDPTS
ncbi:MAG: hypothetical protein EOQ64_18900 [Mesorhizobium sp.]|uniref:hypothetical protein n=1 Tax=Mesorhizobium sp. TaxID=1871066 RepID=UPI000FE96B50|nr:hypothetical protein [Mesorhizobium sp.]RWG54853.1 MAG: hypothetical protein EOQ64_18900 [Mesorhizobium sp.]